MRKSLTPELKEEIGSLLHRMKGLGEFLGFPPNANWEVFRRAYDLNGDFDLLRLLDDLDRYQLWKNRRQQRAITLKRLAKRLLDELGNASNTRNKSIKRYICEVLAQWDSPELKKAIACEKATSSLAGSRSRVRTRGRPVSKFLAEGALTSWQ